MSTFGIEEEFFLIDERTGLPAVPNREATRALHDVRSGGSTTSYEFLACQVESASPICSTAEEALGSLREFRKELARVALDLRLLPVSMGTPPRIPPGTATVANQARYRQMNAFLPGIGAEQYVSGLHVHVSIPDPDAGVQVLNALRPWLPALAAIGANSPFWRGSDTGFASWRSIQYRKWSVQGIPPHFSDAADYHQRLEFMYAADVIPDAGHIGWAARLSERYPTVEVRIADAQLCPEDSVLLALLVRGLVDTFLSPPRHASIPHPEALDLAHWQAAKHGISGNHLDPGNGGSSVTTTQRLGDLFGIVERALIDSGDRDYVETGLAKRISSGNGASRQRRSFARGGFRQVLVDAATEATS